MALPKNLQHKIEVFLKQRKESSGGYAPVDEGEVEALLGIVYDLIEAKYEDDPDGDAPLSVHITDRTRYQKPFILPIPHVGREDSKGVPDISEIHDAIERHLAMAASNTESANTLMRLLKYDVNQVVEQERPVRIKGKTYRQVVVPKAGVELTEEWFVARAKRLFQREEARHPCPSDWDARNAWAKRLVTKLQETWGVFVSLHGCSITTSGVSVSLNIPAIDKVVRFNTR
jgi:hypothetical protein